MVIPTKQITPLYINEPIFLHIKFYMVRIDKCYVTREKGEVLMSSVVLYPQLFLPLKSILHQHTFH